MKLNCKVEKSVPIKNFGYIFSFFDLFFHAKTAKRQRSKAPALLLDFLCFYA